jgi:hypothetical protein
MNEVVGNLVSSSGARKVIYLTFAGIVLFVGIIDVAIFGTLAQTNPDFVVPVWFEITKATMAYLGIPVGGLAAANINKTIEDIVVVVEEPELDVIQVAKAEETPATKQARNLSATLDELKETVETLQVLKEFTDTIEIKPTPVSASQEGITPPKVVRF